ncbi:hypothetical protein Dxin01_00786 [Deinococcus xinjiangensis]|uniref:Uncharacterized protein n=1 Tax=Deinococcus xinjiangensis TaxID=457454 RepID=A0ABP9V946_9DEIO
MTQSTLKTLTVAQLRAALDTFPPETPVAVAASAHDHWGSVLALGIREADLSLVTYSTYHQSYKVRGEPQPDSLEVVLLE